MKINFLDKKKFTGLKKSFWFITIIITILLTIPVFQFISLVNESSSLESEIIALEQRLQDTREDKKEFISLKQKLDILNAISRDIITSRYYWDQIILEQGYIVPDMLKLNYLEIEENRLQMGGITADNDYIIEIIKKMEASELFSGVKIDRIERKNDITFKLHASIEERSD
ncbi:MAG: PilN domain-containing protein [Halanaerobiaceae bacterium]